MSSEDFRRLRTGHASCGRLSRVRVWALFTVPIVAVTACISITKNAKSYAMHITPCGRTLQRQSLDQGPARGPLASYVPRLITSPSSLGSDKARSGQGRVGQANPQE